MDDTLKRFDDAIKATEKKLKQAQEVIDSLKGMIVGHNTVVMLENTFGGNAYLNILGRDEELDTVQFNFSADISTTPRYTAKDAREIVKQYSNEARPLKVGNLLLSAKEDVKALTQTRMEMKEARANLK